MSSTKEDNMKEDLINDLIKGTIERLNKLEVFTLEQAPDLCKEILAEEKTKVENSIIMSLLGVFFSISIFISACSAVYYTEDGAAFLAFVLAAFSLLFTMVTSSCVLSEVLNLRVLKAAPKPLILRELRRYLR